MLHSYAGMLQTLANDRGLTDLRMQQLPIIAYYSSNALVTSDFATMYQRCCVTVIWELVICANWYDTSATAPQKQYKKRSALYSCFA